MTHRLIALLRGINVGKAKRIAMADLRTLLEKLGYTDVKTLLNSGNVVFTSPIKNTADAAAKIEKGIETKLGVTARVIVISGSELAEIIKQNPLQKVMDNPSRFLVGVVNSPADLAKLEPFRKQDWGQEVLAVGKQAVYLWCPNRILESKLLIAISKILKDGITARNWATILKLQAMVEV